MRLKEEETSGMRLKEEETSGMRLKEEETSGMRLKGGIDLRNETERRDRLKE
jgi:hypothetical protein